MLVRDYIKELEKYPLDANIEMFYYDMWGENNCLLDLSYNEFTNTVYVCPGDNIEESDENV